MPKSRTADADRLPTLQARVLMALMPRDISCHPFDYPLYTRSALALTAGYTILSGSITRALNGIRQGNTTSGDPHAGLIERKLVETVVLNIDGIKETNYRITAAGIRAVQVFLATGGKLPVIKDASLCVNNRYSKGSNHAETL